jgi:hypothetical protein
MATQVKTKSGKITGVMRSLAFVRGFQEKLEGLPLDPEAFREDANKQWRYERGRAFACVYQGPLKNGHDIVPSAARAMSDAVYSRYVI